MYHERPTFTLLSFRQFIGPTFYRKCGKPKDLRDNSFIAFCNSPSLSFSALSLKRIIESCLNEIWLHLSYLHVLSSLSTEITVYFLENPNLKQSRYFHSEEDSISCYKNLCHKYISSQKQFDLLLLLISITLITVPLWGYIFKIIHDLLTTNNETQFAVWMNLISGHNEAQTLKQSQDYKRIQKFSPYFLTLKN